VSPAPLGNNGGEAFETSVRQLIANGKSRIALENAKQFHKTHPTAASESLLLDAYLARVQALIDQNLASEAKSLLELVRERFPAAQARLDNLGVAASARACDLGEVLRPLNDPQLDPQRRSAIEQIVQTQIADLNALAECASLPQEHSLRQAAAALERAFNAVASGPVTEEQIALPEVSHRSPLAPWKFLIRAIACFYRGADDLCRECLAGIKPESVPSRLIPALQTMLGMNGAAALKASESALVSQVNVNLAELRAALANLDHAFMKEDESHVFKAMRVAVRECQRSAPDRLGALKQIVSVRATAGGLNPSRLAAALDGAAREDAAFFRMYALAIESSGDSDDRVEACEEWDNFRQHALREGLFRSDGVEAAMLYLHMADVLKGIPRDLLKDVQRSGQWGRKPAAGEDRYFLHPDKLYARSCAIDPHPEALSQWLRWAASQSVSEAEKVAREWHKVRPGDIDPLLYLMDRSEKRNAFPAALSYLEKAERIDAVHSAVRAARLRLLATGALRYLEQRKPHLAAERLDLLAALPQSQQGDRPAFLAALRLLICVASADKTGAEAARAETESLLGGSLPSGLLVFGIASVAKRLDFVFLPDVKDIGRENRAAIPASLARVMAIAKDFGITKFQSPVSYFTEAQEQFPRVSESLDVEQIRALGEMGLATGHPKLAWAASGAGLKRGGPGEAFFALLRARAAPPQLGTRFLALAAAAAELGRFHRDPTVVDQAVEIGRNPFGGESFSLTLEQAREVVRKEIASPAFPSAFNPGPDYSELLHENLCHCADCCRRRGETPSSFDEEGYEDFDELTDKEMRNLFNEHVPEEIPPNIADMFFEVIKDAFRSGKSPDKVIDQILGGVGGGGRGKKKKGRRK
jgi:tetratricopeptide (TPR) repeat protein